jgi:hypothetical protein
MSKTLEEWRDSIRREAPHVDRKPFSHNLITLALGAISREWGQAEANRAIRDFKLSRKGWWSEREGPGR